MKVYEDENPCLGGSQKTPFSACHVPSRIVPSQETGFQALRLFSSHKTCRNDTKIMYLLFIARIAEKAAQGRMELIMPRKLQKWFLQGTDPLIQEKFCKTLLYSYGRDLVDFIACKTETTSPKVCMWGLPVSIWERMTWSRTQLKGKIVAQTPGMGLCDFCPGALYLYPNPWKQAFYRSATPARRVIKSVLLVVFSHSGNPIPRKQSWYGKRKQRHTPADALLGTDPKPIKCDCHPNRACHLPHRTVNSHFISCCGRHLSRIQPAPWW